MVREIEGCCEWTLLASQKARVRARARARVRVRVGEREREREKTDGRAKSEERFDACIKWITSAIRIDRTEGVRAGRRGGE